MKDIKLIVATHKQFQMPKDDNLYLPIHVGAEGKASLGYTGDNTGENISTLNPYYCELTGLYWAWKNLDCDYLGLVHYRRYFTKMSQKFSEAINSMPCICLSFSLAIRSKICLSCVISYIFKI